MCSVFVLDSHSNQGLVSIRSLGSRGLDVTTGSPIRLNGGRFSKYVTHYVTYKDPAKYPEQFVRTILDELRENHYEMLLPVKETTVQTLGEHREQFEEYTNVPLPSYEKLQFGLDKRRTIEAARELDVPHPKTVVASETTSEAAGDILGYPVVIKPAYGDGRQGLSICESQADLERTLQKTRAEYDSILLQEWIPHGGERGVYTLYNWSGELTAHTVQQRLRSSPPEGGASTYRETVYDPDLVSLSDRLLSELDWQGAAMVEFRIDARTNEPKLLEINPTLGESRSLGLRWRRLSVFVIPTIYRRGYRTGFAVRGRCSGTPSLKGLLASSPAGGPGACNVRILHAAAETLLLRYYFITRSVPCVRADTVLSR